MTRAISPPKFIAVSIFAAELITFIDFPRNCPWASQIDALTRVFKFPKEIPDKRLTCDSLCVYKPTWP